MDGEALPVVVEDGGGGFTLISDNLERILLHDSVRDRKVMVVSIAGAFRKGKSLQLNIILRYLSKLNRRPSDWLADLNGKLGGFPWRCGSELETKGILMWSEPFLVPTNYGTNIAVLLMDTQGMFDSRSTTAQTSTIFALSTLLSSVQVYNLSINIQENDLQILHFFTEYGRLAMNAGDGWSRPFQKLMFLVRDWPYEFEYSYGRDGGGDFLAKKLNENEDEQAEELTAVRQHIRSCFAPIDCFLMPEPDKVVRTSPRFDGSLRQIGQTFLEYQDLFVQDLFDSANLQVKTIDGTQLTGSALLRYFVTYMDVFCDGLLPEPTSALRATAIAGNENAVTEALEVYCDGMNQVFDEELAGPIRELSDNELNMIHRDASGRALRLFDNRRKLGGLDMIRLYREKLNQEMMIYYEDLTVRYRQWIAERKRGQEVAIPDWVPWAVGAAGLLIRLVLFRR